MYIKNSAAKTILIHTLIYKNEPFFIMTNFVQVKSIITHLYIVKIFPIWVMLTFNYEVKSASKTVKPAEFYD